MRSLLLGSLLALTFVTGCSDGSTPPTSDTGPLGTDGGGADAARPDAGALDTGVATDTGTGSPDTGTADDAGAVDAFVATDAFAGTDTGDAPPTCTITAPTDGTARDFDQSFTFVATASDPEDGALSGASVVWRSSLVTAPLGTGLSVMTMLVPGVHTIRCTATDSAGNTGTSTIMVTSRSPVASILHPGNGEVRPAASPIPFVGRGNDYEDGMLTGGSLVWTSSLDGMIGTGTMFNRTLSAGTNVVTLTVTDAAGNTGSTSITLTITP